MLELLLCKRFLRTFLSRDPIFTTFNPFLFSFTFILLSFFLIPCPRFMSGYPRDKQASQPKGSSSFFLLHDPISFVFVHESAKESRLGKSNFFNVALLHIVFSNFFRFRQIESRWKALNKILSALLISSSKDQSFLLRD